MRSNPEMSNPPYGGLMAFSAEGIPSEEDPRFFNESIGFGKIGTF